MASEDIVLDILVESGKLTSEQIEKAKEDVGVRAGTILGVLVINGVINE